MNYLPGGWFQTVILLISASRIARFTGVSHQCLAKAYILRIPKSTAAKTTSPLTYEFKFSLWQDTKYSVGISIIVF
jgi:hypothetical protein